MTRHSGTRKNIIPNVWCWKYSGRFVSGVPRGLLKCKSYQFSAKKFVDRATRLYEQEPEAAGWNFLSFSGDFSDLLVSLIQIHFPHKQSRRG